MRTNYDWVRYGTAQPEREREMQILFLLSLYIHLNELASAVYFSNRRQCNTYLTICQSGTIVSIFELKKKKIWFKPFFWFHS